MTAKALGQVGAITAAFLVGPWARDRDDWIQYTIAGGLVVVGVVLWVITYAINKATGTADSDFEDVGKLGG